MKTVAINRCPEYREEQIHESIHRLINRLGGWKTFVRTGDKVVLKPNLVMAKKPENAATTHPAVVKAVITQVQNAGGVVTIADSPGGPYNLAMLRYVYKATGMEQVADETGAILNYDLRVVTINQPQAKFIKQLEVIKPLADADVIINLPKLKTHTMMAYSGAVKNMFGAVAGTTKTDYHLRMPDYDRFSEALIDIYFSVKPTLHIMDAVEAMEGYGPTAGNPKHLGFLLASDDGFALDAVATQIIGLPAENVPVLYQAKQQGRLDESIETTGEPMEAVLTDKFDIPALRDIPRKGRFDKGILKIIKNRMRPRPVIQEESCRRCGRCVDICPPGAMTMQKGCVPVIEYGKCIRCFCCHELCPHQAITIHRSLLSRAIMSGRIAGRTMK